MFSPDVITLRHYYATPFGEGTRALIDASLRQFWPLASREMILSIGFATPYLEQQCTQDVTSVVCMPAEQGAAYWPTQGDNRVFLAYESELPIAESSVNRLLLMHMIEHSEQLDTLIKEAYRVLVPGGRLLAVVPNRLGLWARSPRSPFGYGRPFSHAQVRELLAEHGLTVVRSGSALFIPPTYLRIVWKVAKRIEAIGKLLCPFIGGVLLVEAEKQLYAGIKQPVVMRQPYAVPQAASKPILGMEYQENR